jgi:hypothetical protein
VEVPQDPQRGQQRAGQQLLGRIPELDVDVALVGDRVDPDLQAQDAGDVQAEERAAPAAGAPPLEAQGHRPKGRAGRVADGGPAGDAESWVLGCWPQDDPGVGDLLPQSPNPSGQANMQVADVVELDDDLVAVVEGPLQPLCGLPDGRGVRKGERAGEQDEVVTLGAAVARPQRHGDRVAGQSDVQAIVRGELVDALAQHLRAL